MLRRGAQIGLRDLSSVDARVGVVPARAFMQVGCAGNVAIMPGMCLGPAGKRQRESEDDRNDHPSTDACQERGDATDHVV